MSAKKYDLAYCRRIEGTQASVLAVDLPVQFFGEYWAQRVGMERPITRAGKARCSPVAGRQDRFPFRRSDLVANVCGGCGGGGGGVGVCVCFLGWSEFLFLWFSA